MRIAITGSTGMIGLALTRLALEQGHDVIAIARPGSKKIRDLPVSSALHIKECDISDYERIAGEDNCDIFFHLAWNKTFGKGRDDVQNQLKNIEYTLNAVDLARGWDASSFVGAGSQAEYGASDGKINGNAPVNPTSGYGIAKYTAGKLSSLACKQYGIRFCWARILSVYGEYDGEHTLISYLINSLLNKTVPELTKCEQTWDYIYARDAAQALLSIGMRGKDGKTYCIGSGECRPLKDYVNEIRDAINPDLNVMFGVKEYYPHQTMMLCADIEELTSDTGFTPETDFKDGIARTISHIRSQMNTY